MTTTLAKPAFVFRNLTFELSGRHRYPGGCPLERRVRPLCEKRSFCLRWSATCEIRAQGAWANQRLGLELELHFRPARMASYLHHCFSHGTPSLFPSIFTPGQFLRKNVASAQEVICEQRVRPSHLYWPAGVDSRSGAGDRELRNCACGAIGLVLRVALPGEKTEKNDEDESLHGWMIERSNV
jgi:hypothetical protein